MAQFSDVQLRRLDMTLLLVFETAMASGKLSAAAQRLGLTPSAVSHAVKRLREVFGDELFVRTPQGVRPTPRALALQAPVAEALRLMALAVGPAGFDPARDSRVFRIGASDYETSLFAPLLAGEGAGATRCVFRTLIRREAVEALDAGDLDLLLGFTWDRGKACEAATLFHEDYRVVARRGHPALAARLDLERYTRFGHVLVAPGATLTGIVDKALAGAGASRRVVVAVPYFFAALAAVAQSDLIATVPHRIARWHAAAFGLETAPPPIPLRAFPVQMVWSRRLGGDPALAWLRSRVHAIADRLAAPEPAAADGSAER